MPRIYKTDPKKKQYKKYDPDILKKAVEELSTTPNIKLNEIAVKYNIHQSVLYRHSKKDLKTQGGQTALKLETEKYIIQYINQCGEWGYPLKTIDLRNIVKMFLDKLEIKVKNFKDNLPGPDFVEGFLKRHKQEISQRICENIKRPWAAVSPETIKKYHEELQKSLEGVPPCNIVNFVETNLSDDPGRKKVLMKRGCKYPERIINHSKVSTSIMMAGTADGDMLPPYVVYKATHLYDTWVKNGPKGTRYHRSSSGWFEGTIFEDWIVNMVIPFLKDKPGKKVLIGDNLSSHLSVHVIKTCKEHDIDFVFLPANSTHLTQPLDVAFFRPMKRSWRQLLQKWKNTDGRELSTVPKGCFPKLLDLLIEDLKPNSKKNIKAGFKKTGIHPLNIEDLLERLPQEMALEKVIKGKGKKTLKQTKDTQEHVVKRNKNTMHSDTTNYSENNIKRIKIHEYDPIKNLQPSTSRQIDYSITHTDKEEITAPEKQIFFFPQVSPTMQEKKSKTEIKGKGKGKKTKDSEMLKTDINAMPVVVLQNENNIVDFFSDNTISVNNIAESQKVAKNDGFKENIPGNETVVKEIKWPYY